MTTSSAPAAIDWLVAQAGALPAYAAPVVVCDGWPDKRGDRVLVVGITPDDDETDNTSAHAQLGAQMEWETYDIPCVLWAWVGGGTESAAMKTARDAAFAMFDALATVLRTASGRTLGGALNSGAAQISSWRMRQTADAAEAGSGRNCEIRFVITCKNRF